MRIFAIILLISIEAILIYIVNRKNTTREQTIISTVAQITCFTLGIILAKCTTPISFIIIIIIIISILKAYKYLYNKI